MTKIIEYPLEKGGSVLIAVATDHPEGRELRAGRGDGVQMARESFEVAIAQVKPAIQAVLDMFNGLDGRPDEVEVGFGLTFTGESGVLIASTSIEANFTATLKWKREPASHGA